MTTPNTSNSQRSPAVTGPIEQLLVMHCLKEDSVLGREGFSVRAASPGATDQQMLDWALKLEYYELPLDMKSGSLLANQAPRRLSLVPGPPGRVALIHTAYLPQDTVGRSHSFVSQVLLLPELAAIPAVAAWGSAEWQTSEYPRGETKVLPTLSSLPRGTLIDDAALTAFLSGGPAPADQSLARTIYPGRVESNPEARKRWIRAALHGFLRSGEPNAVRTRVCILAEPGAVALLVYAIARLLPPQISGTFPFSTYEPRHTSLRDNKVARVIGSYARNGIDRADSDSLGRRGYVVDTFRDFYGPELLVESSWPLEGLLKLVSEGDWKGVDEIRELWSRDQRAAHSTPAALADALGVRPLAVALKAGMLDAAGLVALRRNRFGDGLLRDDEFRRPVWEAVRKVWSQPAIGEVFGDTLREHLDELLGEVKGRIEAGPAGTWRQGWEAIKPVIPPDRCAEEFSKLLSAMERTAAALPVEERAGLLGEWSKTAPATAMFPATLHWLLRAASLDDFRALSASPKVSARQVGLAASLAVSGSVDWAKDPALLKDLQEEQFHAFVSELPKFEQRQTIYDRLRSDGALGKVVVDRLIRLRTDVPPACAEEVLSAVGCGEPAWREYWAKSEGKNFAAVLKRLPSGSRLAYQLWDGMLAQVTPDNFVDGQASGLGALVELGNRYAGHLEETQKKRLDSWSEINLAFADPPKSQPAGKAISLANACRAVGVTREVLTERWFRVQVLPARKKDELKVRAEKFGRSVLGFYESDAAACEQALKLANEVKPEELCRVCKTQLFETIVAAENRDKLAGRFETELRETSIRPRAQVELRERPRHTASARKGVGVGNFRIPPQSVPYVVTFVSGGIFTAVLMLLLAPWVAQVTGGWFHPSEAAQAGEEKITEKKLSVQLAAKDDVIEGLQEKLKNQKTEIARLNLELSNKPVQGEKAATTSNTPGQQPKANEPGGAGAPDDNAGAMARLEPPAGANSAGATPGSAAERAGGDNRRTDSRPKETPSATPPRNSNVTAASTPGAATTGGPESSNPNAPGATSVRKQLNELILDQPLNEQGVPQARALATKLGGQQDATHRTGLDELLRLIVSNLSIQDVPTNIPTKPLKDSKAPAAKDVKPKTAKSDPPSKTDFAFVNSGEKDRLALATLRFRPESKKNSLTVYFLNLERDPIWTNKLVSANLDTIMSSSSSGEFFLLGSMAENREVSNYYLIRSARFFNENSEKQAPQSLSFSDRALSLPSPVGVKPAFSDDGRFCAIAEAESGVLPNLPRIKVCSIDPASKQLELKLDFGLHADKLERSWTIAGMSFDKQGKSLVVGFTGQPFLMVFALSDDPRQDQTVPALHSLITLSGLPPLGWAHCPDGRHIAVVSDGKIFVDDLAALRANNKQPPMVLIDNNSKHSTCVAFGPKGTVLATGDSGGVIAIRALSMSADGTGPIQGKVLMQLEHVGPIQKLAFSPDGRILAALARPPDGRKEIEIREVWSAEKNRDRPGVIRLWVTENWERGEDAKGKQANTEASKPN